MIEQDIIRQNQEEATSPAPEEAGEEEQEQPPCNYGGI